MDFPSFFLISNIFKFFIFLGLILIVSACSVPTREYSYPDVNTLEQQRLCQLVSFRKTSQYLVADRKIMPMKKDEIMAPVQDTESDLQKGVYFCGIFQARHYDCSPYQTSRLDGKKCRYQRWVMTISTIWVSTYILFLSYLEKTFFRQITHKIRFFWKNNEFGVDKFCFNK